MDSLQELSGQLLVQAHGSECLEAQERVHVIGNRLQLLLKAVDTDLELLEKELQTSGNRQVSLHAHSLLVHVFNGRFSISLTDKKGTLSIISDSISKLKLRSSPNSQDASLWSVTDDAETSGSVSPVSDVSVSTKQQSVMHLLSLFFILFRACREGHYPAKMRRLSLYRGENFTTKIFLIDKIPWDICSLPLPPVKDVYLWL